MADTNDTLRVGLLAPVHDLDPRGGRDFVGSTILEQVFETPFDPPETPDGPARPVLFAEALRSENGGRVLSAPVRPDVYDHPDMQGYREWLDDDCVEANWVLGGSFVGDDVTDYYLGLEELGYGRLADFDHDFVGRDALSARVDDPARTKVTFVWDGNDVVDVFASLFRDGDTYKFAALPDLFQQWDHGHFDRVEVGGEPVGVSMYTAYDYNERAVLSLGVVDTAHAEPGTDVTVVWGEAGSAKPTVERHVEKAIGATVAPAPYVRAREDL